MTLIAAYRPYGVPILIGDFLITGGSGDSTNKKIYRISSNFVIGWTGNLMDARRILRGLIESFEDQIVTIAEVERYLTQIPADEKFLEDLHLLGWIIEDDNPFSFRWNIQYPGELFPGNVLCDGTGGEKFLELLKNDVTGSRVEQAETPMHQAIYSVIFKAAELFSDESSQRINQSRGFGHGYEILYYDGKEFRYLESIGFSAADAYWDEDKDAGNSRHYKYWYHYQSFGASAHLRRYDLETGDLILEFIEPVVDGKGSLRKNRENLQLNFIAGSFRADYYALFIRLRTSKNRYVEVAYVLPEVAVGPSKYEILINGRSGFFYGEKLIRDIYETAKFIAEHKNENVNPIGWGGAETAEHINKANARFVFQASQTDKTVTAGLTNIGDVWNYDYRNVDFVIMCRSDGTVQLYEKGHAVGPLGIQYSVENIFILELLEVDGQLKINYLIDNHFIYQSMQTPVLPLKAVIALREEGAKIHKPLILYL